jgi:hypothetical protein
MLTSVAVAASRKKQPETLGDDEGVCLRWELVLLEPGGRGQLKTFFPGKWVCFIIFVSEVRHKVVRL